MLVQYLIFLDIKVIQVVILRYQSNTGGLNGTIRKILQKSEKVPII